MNVLEPGAGGAVSPAAAVPNPINVRPKSRPQSGMMKHFSGHREAAADRFAKMQEAKKQIDSVMDEFGQLAAMADTVTVKDVVKGCAGIVAAGVPAVQMATILADMPEQPAQLQAWVSDEYQKAQSADQKISEGLAITRHGLISSSLQHLIAHSAESQQLAQAVPAGSA